MKHRDILLSIFLFNAFYASAQDNTYYIGHSGFGWDLIVGEMVNDLAADAGITTYDYGFQFIGGTCISNQWLSHAEPQGGTDSHFELPTGNYDNLVLAEQIPIQEVIDSNTFGCSLTSFESVTNFYNMATAANPNTQVYLMEFHNEINLNNTDPYTDWVNLNAAMRPLWNRVADSVNRATTGPDIQIVPVAAAYQAMADSIRAGVFPGMTDWLDIFDPNDIPEATIHPTEVTYYLSACVHFAVFFNRSPEGLTHETFAAAGWQFDPPTVSQATMMQQIAWEIVSATNSDAITSIPEVSQVTHETDLLVFPNPAVDRLTLKPRHPFKSVEIKIFDLSGMELRHFTQLQGQEVIVDLSGLTAGIYTYTLSDLNKGVSKGTFRVK